MRAMPYFLLVLAVMFWSGNFIVSKWFVDAMPPYTLSFIRWFVALLVVLPFCWKDIVQHRKLWAKHWKLIVILAVTGIISFNTLINFSQYYTSPTNAAIIEASTPVLSPFIAKLFIKERLAVNYYIGMVIALAGVIWIIGRESLAFGISPNIGDLLSLIGVIVWCLYSAITKKTEGRFPPTANFVVCIFAGLLILLPFSVGEWQGMPAFHWTPVNVLSILFTGCCCSVLAYLFWNKGVVAIGPSRATLFLTLLPIFTAVYAALFLGEAINFNQVLAGCLILVGVFIAVSLGNRRIA